MSSKTNLQNEQWRQRPIPKTHATQRQKVKQRDQVNESSAPVADASIRQAGKEEMRMVNKPQVLQSAMRARRGGSCVKEACG